MIWFLLTLLILCLIACAWLYNSLRKEQWEHQEEARMLRISKDQYETRADDLEQRLDARIHEVSILTDDLHHVKDQYAAADGEMKRAVEELLALRDDLTYWKASAEHWQQEYEKANQDAIKAREIVADWVAQRTFGKSIFHVAPALPVDPKLRKPIPRQRIQGRLAVKLAEQQFEKAEREFLERQKNGGKPPAIPAESAVQVEIGTES